ncbi:heterogeneous nuclear ribonucleoprotein-related [Anaeramoeba flamelloides]|uniref:Heterogeneous nuclear ribonucleoprotein-related n=1 Tax=Anaeramoeba flamelloides TaxID=1746091 RepID=A0AAV7ZSV1_9EUKA|nr:heterogeneous nuclear ribonucleoprotein-related [Anaeramoeba flamelloides]
MENNFLKVINIFDKSSQSSTEKITIKTNPQTQLSRKPKIINLDPEPKNTTNQTPKTKTIPPPNYFRLQLSTPEPQINYAVVDLSLKKTKIPQQKKIQSKVSSVNENKITQKQKYRNPTKIITKPTTRTKLLKTIPINTNPKPKINTKSNLSSKTKTKPKNAIKTEKSFLFLNTDHSREILTNEKQKTFQIFISGLNFDSQEQDVLNYFSKYDRAISAKLVYNKNGKKTGQAFVTYRTQEEANRAVHFYHKQTMMSRWLWVRLSNDDRKITRPKKKFRSNKPRKSTRKVPKVKKNKIISIDNNTTNNNNKKNNKNKNYNNQVNNSYSNIIINTDNEKSNLNTINSNIKQNKNHFSNQTQSKPPKNIGSKLIDLTALFK